MSIPPELLQPLPLGAKTPPLGARHTMPNRIVFGAHLTNFGQGRRFTERHRNYYAARASGGVGMIVTEALTVHPQDYPYEHAPRGETEAIVPSLEALAAVIRAPDAAAAPLLLAQLNHSGGQTAGRMLRQSPWAPSPVADVASRKMARAMTLEEIAQVVEGFALAAGHVAAAGLDGVELNAGQHSLLRQFLSPLSNFREDDYGGSPENCLRMTLQVLGAVRARLGPEPILGIKLCGDELAPWGGLTPQQAAEIALRLVDSGQVDYLSIQLGGPFSVHQTDPGMPTAQGYGAEAAGLVREAVGGRVPIFAEGRLEMGQAAGQVLAAGQADAVVMTRALVSDPELPKKLAGLDGEPVRPHIGMMRYFSVRGDWNRPLGDLSNPRAGREAILPPVERLHRPGAALVIGGGPAGMEAALTLARQGRRVKVVEASAKLGGMAAVLAREVESRSEFALLVDYQAALADRLGLEVETGRTIAGYQEWMEEFAVIVLATGGRMPAPPFGAAGRMRCISARALLEDGAGKKPAQAQAVVVDGEHGFRMAAAVETLLQQGWRVDVVSEDFFVGRGLVESAELGWFKRVGEQGARLHPRLRFKSASGRRVVCEDRFSGEERKFEPAGLLVYALPDLPADDLLPALRKRHPRVLRVGDAAAPRLMGEAILNAHRTVLLEA